jgi:hypothetical protein
MNKHVPFIWRVNYRNDPRAPEAAPEIVHEKPAKFSEECEVTKMTMTRFPCHGDCRRAIARDFGSEFCSSASVTAPVERTCPSCSEGKPWCRNLSVARTSIRPQGHFRLSVRSGDQLPLRGPPVWRPRSLVASAALSVPAFAYVRFASIAEIRRCYLNIRIAE